MITRPPAMAAAKAVGSISGLPPQPSWSKLAAVMKAAKTSRNITVNTIPYRWRATGNDGSIDFAIWPTTLPGPAIVGHMPYGGPPVDCIGKPGQLVITNRLIRRVILLACQRFLYDPSSRGRELRINHCDRLIDATDAVRSSGRAPAGP